MYTEIITDLLAGPSYAFLRENENLGNRVILLSLSGSHAYGTDVSTSDLDIRGITIERDSVIWGLQDFEQFEDRLSDTVIFGFKKIIKLLMDCNPNALEILAVKDEHVLLSSETGRLLRENIDMFLSRKCILTFGGYAAAQLKRLENALARDAFTQPQQEEHIMQSVISKMNNLAGHFSDYTKSGSIDLYIDSSAKEDYEKEIFMDIDLSHFPLRDFTVILNDMLEVTKQYAKLNHRNRKKPEGSLLKHAMHLIRLLEMGTEVLEGKGLQHLPVQ